MVEMTTFILFRPIFRGEHVSFREGKSYEANGFFLREKLLNIQTSAFHSAHSHGSVKIGELLYVVLGKGQIHPLNQWQRSLICSSTWGSKTL